MTTHLGLMVLFSAFVSTVFAALMRETLPEQVRFAGQAFAGFVGGGIVLGWLLYALPL